jgi:NADH-quinone oxidoreductase subunit N
MAAMPDLVPVLPELLVALFAMALLVYGAYAGDRAVRSVSWIAVLVLVVAGVVVAGVAARPGTSFGGQFILDEFAVFAKWLVLLGSALTIVISLAFNERQGMARFEYPILILFATLGMMMMVSANDLIALYVAIELQSLALYVIAAFQRDNARSSEAGLKYFVLGGLSSGMLLYGLSFVYGFAGTTNFDKLASLFGVMGEPSTGLIVGLVFVIAGLAFKLAAVPFHMWTPDVYEGAPTPVTAFFAAAPKIAAFALTIRVLVGPFGDLFAQWQQIIVVIAVLSMVLGALAAIMQSNIKRLLAYSSIGHVGYALIGVAAGSETGVQGVLIYLAIYVVMVVGTFCCVLCMRQYGRPVESIADLAGLSRTHPLIALAFGVFMFSMAGIPPLAGFFGKLYVFLAAVEAGLYVLAVIGVLTSVVAAFYYLRIVKLMYFDDPAEGFERPIPREVGLVMAGTGLLTFLFFIHPSPLIAGAKEAAAVLFAG